MASELKILYVLLCRLSSSRLPGKMLMEINGQPLLRYPLDSLLAFTDRENVVVATSVESSDDRIADYCKERRVQCYRGSLDNVAERFLGTFNTDDERYDYVVRVCGDNVFLSHHLLSEIRDQLHLRNPDFLSNTPDRTYPYGMSFEVIRPALYRAHYPHFAPPLDHEHVMPYFYRNGARFKTLFMKNSQCPTAAGLKLAVDTMNDLKRVEMMLKNSSENYFNLSLEEIVELYPASDA